MASNGTCESTPLIQHSTQHQDVEAGFNAEPRSLMDYVQFKMPEPMPCQKTWDPKYHVMRMKYILHVLMVNWIAAFFHCFTVLAIVLFPFNPPAMVTFIVNGMSIISLSIILGTATDMLAQKLGAVIGGLMNATLGNVVEVAIAIIAILKGDFLLVQNSLIGSILSNTLLVLGLSFFCGGIAHGPVQEFDAEKAQSMAALLFSSCFPLILLSVMGMVGSEKTQEVIDSSNLSIGHVVAICLLVLYVAYLIFSLRTDPELSERSVDNDGDDDEICFETVESFIILIVTTVLVAILAGPLVESVDQFAASANLSPDFIGLILLPIIGNAAEHGTAILVAMKNKVDIAIAISLGSGIQIALLVSPICVLAGWVSGNAFTLAFPILQSVTMFASFLIVLCVIVDGKSNYFEGINLVIVYIIVGTIFYFF